MSEVNGHSKNGLPKGWHKVKLGDIISVSSGKGIKINGLQGGKYPVYGGNGINGYHSEYLLDDPKLIIGRVGVKCGVTHITKPKSWVSDNALIVEPKIKDFNLKFFKLKLQYEDLNKLSVSTAQPVISGSKIYAYEIVYPDIEIQNEIVSKIEELFSELDKSIEQLKTAQRQLKVYRQSVLKCAFEGKLTNKNVKEGELPSSWQWTKLNQIGKWTGGGTPSKQRKDFWENGDVLWVSPKDMKVPIIHDTIDKITVRSIGESSTKKIEKGSILFVVRSGIIRRTLPIAMAGKNLTTNQDMQSLTLKNDLSEYVYWYCVANEQQIRDTCAKDGTTVDNLEVPKLKEYPICICSDEEQLKVVQKIESRLSVVDKLEETIANSLQQAEALRQSILKKAFEGRFSYLETTANHQYA